MATSGVASFDPTFDDILQDAAAMVGGGPILADELISARRGLDYMLTSIQNQNVLLHKIETTTVPVTTSEGTVTFGPSISDVLSASTRTSATDILMDRDGYERWAEIPTKSQTGRPTRYWWDRRRNSNILNLWPLPDQSYTIVLTIQKNAEDTLRAFDNIDVPRRFLPAVTFGLAYWIGLRRGARVDQNRLALLKAEYEAQLKAAMREDRERGPFLVRIGRR
jgi:hypothetical protein